MRIVFWILEGILYGVFLTGDWCDYFGVSWITGTDWYVYSNICKYVAMLLCVWYGCRLGWKEGDSRQRALCGVLLFAAVADYFLLFTNHFILGILFFCMVQCCYCLYFGGRQGSRVLCRMAGTGVCVVVLIWLLMQIGIVGDTAGWKREEFYLLLAAVFYGSLLLQNLIKAWKPFQTVSYGSVCEGRSWEQGKVCFRSASLWGPMAILLLFLCDIHVALYNIEGMDFGMVRPLWLQIWCKAAGVLMWLFYLPSQLCIVKCIQGQSTHK